MVINDLHGYSADDDEINDALNVDYELFSKNKC